MTEFKRALYLRGRIHLKTITENYKRYQNLFLEENRNGNKSKATTDPSAEEEFKTYDPNYWGFEIRDDGSIRDNGYGEGLCNQNDLSAIAAVDYAMRETKPSCGLVKEFKIIPK